MKQQLFISISSFALKLALVFSILFGLNVSAQTYPVQTNISSSGPYLNYLSYYGDDNNHLQLTVTQLDFNEPPILARLRIRIEGPGYELYTNPNSTVGQPFLLDAGMPLTITGIDLLPYLQQGNLINPSGVDLNNLPHGFTTVCVDVIRESASQQVLSTNNCGFLPIQEYQPPQTFIPTCGDVLDTNTMFHTFTWTPPVPFPAGVGLELFYDFSIYQWADPNNNSALGGTSILVYEATDLIAPTTQVSDFDVIFELGRTYVWKVTARVESNGMPISLIENGGVSAPCTFIYGEAPTLNDVLADGLEIQLFTSPSSERKGKAWWTVTDNTPNAGLSTFDAYFVEYRKQPTGNEGFEIPWFSKTLSSLEYFIYQLEPSTAYEVKVSGVIAGTIGDPTPVETFTTPDPRIYNCGESDVPYLPTNYTPLENAAAGTQVKIGQFMMTMTEVTAIGSAGHYKGKGEIPIAFLAGAKAKVRFDDILIDTEYLVHEGRVDVITEGLANWLDDQYQQFIDPYFVEGTIDSAYVQDSVAWVVVDGVPQSFNFDPPNYPIIVNDESGNQYTIYPNGTIVVSSYLSISETWAATADEVIHFTQSDSELRGFDPKEHMEWFENYEVMELGDSSKYFVANKSLAKDEADKVNVEIPSGATASFEFSDGTAVPSSSLQGSWIGATEHTGSSKMTLDIPARSSSGNYSIYALVNGQKVGQLNVKVYSQKDKELIVVPLVANSGISEIDIENELRKTLGEANIEVDVTLESPWIDSTGTFTASTNISMPSEVGLLSKYSDDMRELRDAYFEQHPSAPKNKYYLFLVNGFDDPNELGYMVRGRSMGFVKASQPNILKTISHELGHGMGALEHTFKDDVIAKGSTNNLMDYSADPTNLTKAQWKELRDLDVAPSLWDGTEDAANAVVSINDYDLESLENSDGSVSFVSPSGKPISLKGSISKLTFQTLSLFGGQGSLNEGVEQPPFGCLVEFVIDGILYTMDFDESGQFLGYGHETDTSVIYFSELFSQANNNTNMCVGLPVFMNGEFGLGITKCDLAITNISGANTANGAKQELEFLVDNYCNNLQSSNTHVLVANIDQNTDFTEELLIMGELMEVIDSHLSLSGIQVSTAVGPNYEQGHYFGVSAYLVFKLLTMINQNKDAIPCTQFLSDRLDNYFNTQISTQAYQQALTTHYSSPVNQSLSGEYLDINVQPEVFTQSTNYTDITLVNTAAQGNGVLMSLTDPTDINILKRNLVLKHFFSQQEQLLNVDNSVNFVFIDGLKAKLHSSLSTTQTISEDQRLEVRCMFAGLNYSQRSSLIDYCFTKMSTNATGTNRAPYAEIVLSALEISPPSQISQLRTLMSANGYAYYNQLANLITPNDLYENSTAAFANWVVNGATSQKARAIRIIDHYARNKNQAIQSAFDPSLSPTQNGVEFVPLVPMTLLSGMNSPSVTSSYSAGSNTYTFTISNVNSNGSTTVTAAPYDLLQVEVLDNFNNQYVVRPDNNQPLKQGDKFLIPASSVHNLIQQNELAVYNVGLTYLLEAAFIVGTAGTGLGFMALEITIMAAQMVIEDNMGDIQYMDPGPQKNMILGFRNYADFIVVGAGLSQMLLNGVQRSPYIIREQVGDEFKFTFKHDEKGMALDRLNEAGKLGDNITKIRGILNSMDDVTDVGLVSVKKHLEAFELDSRFLQIAQNTGAHKVHFGVISKKPVFHYIPDELNPTSFTPKNLFNASFIANNTKVRLETIQWLSPSYNGSLVIVSRMENLNYKPQGEVAYVDGRLEVVKTNTGQLYMRIPPFDLLLSTLRNKFDGHSNILTWLDEIPESKIGLLEKLDDLPNNSTVYTSLDSDIANTTELKTAFNGNPDLIDSWKVVIETELATDAIALGKISNYLKQGANENLFKIDMTDVLSTGNQALKSQWINTLGNNDWVLVRRVTDRTAELQDYELSGYLLSDAATQKFYETGNVQQALNYSDQVHQQWLGLFNGNISAYAAEHALKGTEMETIYGFPRTLISTTTDKNVLSSLNQNGTGRFFIGVVEKNDVVLQTLSTSGESEVLFISGSNLLKEYGTP